ncbi:MAG: FAD-binding domain-containing protein [Pseudomonadota bacterium]
MEPDNSGARHAMNETLPLPGFEPETEAMQFEPTRASGLARLEAFAPRTARVYSSQRNYDFGPDKRGNVSCLSPWIRHRLISEEEVLRAVLTRHNPASAEKFIQEVFWRGYFKGWLEQRPSVWTAYRAGLDVAMEDAARDRGLRADMEAAMAGQTGIDAFDAWARELVETGYLHNHARMWFASIWIFTLRLPWEVGADFFLRHLLDGDPASNTLSWRWVAGLHTKGKTYAARASNINKYTGGRFHPLHQLSSQTDALVEDEDHARVPLPLPLSLSEALPSEPFLLLITEEDGTPDQLLTRPPAAIHALSATAARSPYEVGKVAQRFAAAGLKDALQRISDHYQVDGDMGEGDWAKSLCACATRAGVHHIVTPYVPVGPVSEVLQKAAPDLKAAGLTLTQVRRSYDTLTWPHATKGFFGLKKKIPGILSDLNLR